MIFALINPGPQTPIGFAVNLNAAVCGRSEPAVIDQKASATDAGIPAHLLVNRDFHLCTFREFDTSNCFCIFIGERFLAQQMFAGSRDLFDDGGLLGGIDSYVDDFDLRLT